MAGRPLRRARLAAEAKRRSRRSNPGLGDYVRAGKRAVAAKVADTAAGIQRAADTARVRADAEAKKRVADKPTVKQALQVLAEAHGVKINPARGRRKNPLGPARGKRQKREVKTSDGQYAGYVYFDGEQVRGQGIYSMDRGYGSVAEAERELIEEHRLHIGRFQNPRRGRNR